MYEYLWQSPRAAVVTKSRWDWTRVIRERVVVISAMSIWESTWGESRDGVKGIRRKKPVLREISAN